jgi:Tfp pilus assembly protein PilN
MRPVNLIPPEQRHDGNAPLRSGFLVYVVLGALALLLIGVTALVLTNNEISDRKSELASVKAEDAAAAARAQRLAPYTQFRSLREQRAETVSSLADSRFDWERVMRELSLILPGDVWLTSLKASAGGEGSERTAGVEGPSLQVTGCAAGHDQVAGFVTALKDIDGVTRVELKSSAVPMREPGAGTVESGDEAAGGEGSGQSCPAASFDMTVAFDAAPVPSGGTEAEVETTSTETESTESTESSEGS